MLESTMILSLCLFTLVITFVPTHSLERSLTQNSRQNSRLAKRSYGSWPGLGSNSLSQYNAANIFKPSPYTIPRPYYIPVYGSPGNYLFYPPQPLYGNPGYPIDNPVKPPYQGSSYLPPPKKEDPSIDNRYGASPDMDMFDDAPIWGNGDKMVQMPLSNDQNKEWAVTPTRAPPSSTRTTSPPLFHTPIESQSRQPPTPQRPSRPQNPTTQRPSTQEPPGPNNCVWAIISCCSADNPTVIAQNCFEQRGCAGPFWGDSPCNSEFARAAIETAMKYYSSNPGA